MSHMNANLVCAIATVLILSSRCSSPNFSSSSQKSERPSTNAQALPKVQGHAPITEDSKEKGSVDVTPDPTVTPAPTATDAVALPEEEKKDLPNGEQKNTPNEEKNELKCEEDNNKEEKTFSWYDDLVSQVNANIAAKKLKFKPLVAGRLIRRSTGATGGGFKWTSDGVIDTAGLGRICEALGYRNYKSSTCVDQERSALYPNGKCNFHSPENDYLQSYDANGNIVVESAAPKYNKTRLITLTCQGRLICQ